MICCICGDIIKSAELLALGLEVRNIHKNSAKDPRQSLFAHDYCFARVLHSSTPFDSEVLAG
jgi:hypothetical protein